MECAVSISNTPYIIHVAFGGVADYSHAIGHPDFCVEARQGAVGSLGE